MRAAFLFLLIFGLTGCFSKAEKTVAEKKAKPQRPRVETESQKTERQPARSEPTLKKDEAPSKPSVAVQERPNAEADKAVAESKEPESKAVVEVLDPAERTLTIVNYNVESGGSDEKLVAEQLVEAGPFDIIALCEVDDCDAIHGVICQQWGGSFDYILGGTGIYEDGPDDRLCVMWNSRRLEDLLYVEIKEVGGIRMHRPGHRAPLAVKFRDRRLGTTFWVVQNHLARGDANFREQQARGLREWARSKSIPIICVGDFNFDYHFHRKKGNEAMDSFMRDNVWKWIRPEEMIDTNWSDRDRDGRDDYPDSMLDFAFVAGAAKEWAATCRVITREDDFPDDRRTSDHRPVELKITIPQPEN